MRKVETPHRSPARTSLPPGARSWQLRPGTQLLAAAGVVLPMAAITWWVFSTGDQVTLRTMFLGPLAIGGVLILWIVFLQRFFCGDSMASLGFFVERPLVDVVLGIGLAPTLLLLQSVFRATVGRLLPPRPPVPQILGLLDGVARDPWLLLLWLGPVVWIGVALLEELARCFVLRRLWLVGRGQAWNWTAVILVSSLTGLGHAYQGSAAMVSIALNSVVMGAVYLYTGRIRGLIVAHALFDSIQIGFAVVAIRGMSG
jgi:hypothetical protein